MQHGSETIWNNIRRYAKKAGRGVIEMALKLWFAAQNPDVPKKARAMIYGALAYLVTPIDAIPDLIPGGFADDVGVLAAALVTVSMYITPEVKARVKQILDSWFGTFDPAV